MCRSDNIRRFLFHTALASGAAGLPPLAGVALRGEESRRPLPDFATSRGRFGAVVVGPVCGAVAPVAGFSPSFEGAVGATPFAARKVLFTETGLNEANFLTVDVVRACPLSSPTAFEASAFEASVSDPPLTLTSAEMPPASAGSALSSLTSFFSFAPFTRGWGCSKGASWLVGSVLFWAQISKMCQRTAWGSALTSS